MTHDWIPFVFLAGKNLPGFATIQWKDKWIVFVLTNYWLVVCGDIILEK